ncbi:MAG: pilus assembly protein [Alphaproteobacteria bacterium]|jgi:Flp pilus assembly protein TadG|nr:pilus assembly protein [Alphaproteobacteria bacterium]
MFSGFVMFRNFTARWGRETEAVATVEAALVFPILLTLLLGTFDMGNGILANQKTIRASQIVADLITRNMTVDDVEIEEAVTAGGLAFEPLDSSSYGVDIVSIRFDDDAQPEIVWRETTPGMAQNQNVLEDVASLAEADNGVVVVTVAYVFEPVFAGFVLNEMTMREVAFARGRRSAVVNMEE